MHNIGKSPQYNSVGVTEKKKNLPQNVTTHSYLTFCEIKYKMPFWKLFSDSDPETLQIRRPMTVNTVDDAPRATGSFLNVKNTASWHETGLYPLSF